MARINIPMNDWSRDKLRKRIKNATSRNKRYGWLGDTFLEDVGGRMVEYGIIEQKHTTLREVRDVYFRMEGCETPEEFEQVWIDIHPRAGFQPEHKVWLHIFVGITEQEWEAR